MAEESFVILSIPASVIRERRQFPETYELPDTAVGKSFIARARNDLGMIEFWITKGGADSSNAADDSLWVEPEFLRASKTGAPAG